MRTRESSAEHTRIKVVCALIERRGRLLVARRSQRMSMAGRWEFPGGKVHLNEDLRSAIVREIAEELGCTIRVKRGLITVHHEYPDLTVSLVPFVCELADGEPVPLEHDELRWATEAELLALEWSAADVPVLRNYLAERNAPGP
jgi:8-oxo-dGTP diphosphatase